jgi:hypothetical protein
MPDLRALAAVAVLAAWPAAAQVTPAGTATALDSAALARVQTALIPTLPGYDAARQCWPARAFAQGNEAVACIRLAAARRVETEQGPLVFALLNGKGRDDCHPCTGLAAVAVLDGAGRVIVAPTPEPSGSYGAPTDAGSIVVTRFGARSWGLIEAIGYGGQGVFESSYALRILHEGALKQAGTLPAGVDNSGQCDVKPGQRFEPTPLCRSLQEIKVSLRVDDAEPGGFAYPIVLEATGTRNQRPVREIRRVPFDPAAFAYPTPAAWP